MNKNRLFLSGPMGVGKSKCGAQLALKTGAVFFDLDEEITAREGRTIAAIFEKEGEQHFRDLEAFMLDDLLARLDLLDALSPEMPQKSVIALGGGTITQPALKQKIRTAGLLCTLTAQPETLAARTAADSQVRPLASDLRCLLLARQRDYEDADWLCPTEGQSISEVVERLSQWWQQQADGSQL